MSSLVPPYQINLKQQILNLLISRYASRWMILIIDLLLSAFSFAIAYWIVISTYPSEVYIPPILIFLPIYLLLSGTFYVFFRTHEGVIRYSSYQEIGRITIAVFTTNLLLCALIFVIPSQSFAMLISLLVKNATLTFFSLVIFRYIIVRIYIHLTDLLHTSNQPKALIFGISSESVGLCSLLNNNPKSAFKILGFITNDLNTDEQLILNLPIFVDHSNALEKIKQLYKVEAVIFPSQDNLLDEKNHLVETAIRLHIKILLAQSPKTWTKLDNNQKGKISTAIRPIQIEDLLSREEIQINLPAIEQEVKNKVILITGAAGSIGSEIVRQIAHFNPQTILLFDIAETPLYQIETYMKEYYPEINIEAIIGDVRFTEHLEVVFQRHHPQIIYHAAAYKHVPMMEQHPSEAILANVLGTRNVANYALKYGAETFIMISTDKAVNPTNVMGASKRIAEIYVQSLAKYVEKKSCSTQFITTRFGNVLGSNGSVIPRFKEQIEKGGPITVTHPNIIRYFMTIPEACRLVLEASINGKNGEIYVFDMGDPVKIDDLARNMIRLAGLVPDVDIQIAYTGLRPGEKLYEELLTLHEITKPTKHQKIMVAQVQEFELREVTKGINELIVLAERIDSFLVVKKMKELVPEFRSMNSIYAKLDKEIVENHSLMAPAM